MIALNKKLLRQFGLLLSSGLALIFGLLLPWLTGSYWPTWPWVVSFFFAAVSLIFPASLKPLYCVWMRVGDILSWFNTRLILGFIYFLVFTPISLFFRLSGRDAMQRRPDSSLKSYRVKSRKLDIHRMRDPF